ncbi:mechanosensitive ion channel domain-containing protein [Nitrosomonas sp. ANs5]|uniref:mechanosensitive ion channel domain-containing protein n=1 Tax=Nitrosomonas sp. ANs5 TaxID=3423941 RepID=UPI003D3259A9
MRTFLQITLFIILVLAGSGMGVASKFSEQLQAIQAKLEALGNGEETPQKKRLREIYTDHQQVLLDHQEYLEKTAAYTAQLESYPKLLDDLKKRKIPPDTAPIDVESLAKLSLSELEQRHVATQASLSELQNQQQKSASDLARLRQRAVTIREELAATNQLRSALTEKSAETKKETDKKIQEALERYRDAHLQSLTDKTRMLELEALALPHAIENAALQERLLLTPRIRLLEREVELMAEEISWRRRAETEQVVEKSQQLLGEKDWEYPALASFAEDNQTFARKLSHYAQLSTQLKTRKTRNENRLALITQSHAALQQRLELKGEDIALGTEIRRQFKEIMTKPDLTQTERELNRARLELFQLEQEKLQMMNEKAYFRAMMGNDGVISKDAPDYQQVVDTFNELKQSRDQIIAQFIEVLHNYIKEQQLQLAVQNQLIDRIGQHKLLLKENLLVTRSARPLSMEIVQDTRDALDWLISSRTWAALEKVAATVWRDVAAVFAVFILLFGIAMYIYWPSYLSWERTCNSLRGKVNQDKLLYPIGMFVTELMMATFVALPFLLTALILRHSLDTEISHAMAVSFRVMGVAVFSWMFLFLLFHPEGLLIGQFRCSERLVGKMYRDVRRYAPLLVVLSGIFAFTDALDDDLVRNSIGRLVFILFCLLLAGWAWGWMAMTRSGRKLYEGETFSLILNPRFWMTLLFLLQGYMIVMASVGYYFAAIYQYQLVFESIAWTVFCSLIFYIGFRSLLIMQRQIAYERAVEKREEMLAQRAASGKGETEQLVDENYIDIKSISKQSATLLKISIWGLLIVGLWVIWVDMLPALNFLERITIWHVAAELEGEAIMQPITLQTLLIALIVLTLSMIAAQNLPGTLELLVLRHLSLSTGTGYAVTTLLRYAIVIIGVFVTFQKLGMEWSNIQWLVAALGVGLGFGLQEIFANFVSGLILLFERPIRIGDIVTLNNISGTVSKIHIRATTLIDFDRKEIVVPNKIFITEQLTNWSLSDQVTRVVIPVGIAYGSDCDNARALLLEIANDHPLVLRDPEPAALFLEFGASSLNFELRVFAEQLSDRLKLTHELHILINRRFSEAGITIAFPQLDVHLHTQDEQKTAAAPPTAAG